MSTLIVDNIVTSSYNVSGTISAETVTANVIAANSLVMASATGGNMGVGTVNATEYYRNGLPLTTRVLLNTVPTTSGTSQSISNIPAYEELFIEFAGVSFANNAVAIQMEVSDDNGANYGLAQTVTVAASTNTLSIYGYTQIRNLQSANNWCITHGATANALGNTAIDCGAILGSQGNLFGPYNAIRFSGSVSLSVFDGGTIRVYGRM
jgi:hypothetical protein